MPKTGKYTISSCVARRKGRKQQMDRISLWYCEGASDKTYQAEIVPVSDGFQVNFAYGRRGSTMNTGTKTSKPGADDDAGCFAGIAWPSNVIEAKTESSQGAHSAPYPCQQ